MLKAADQGLFIHTDPPMHTPLSRRLGVNLRNSLAIAFVGKPV
jgi:hypothetical protein